jgi:hypothetical protein
LRPLSSTYTSHYCPCILLQPRGALPRLNPSPGHTPPCCTGAPVPIAATAARNQPDAGCSGAGGLPQAAATGEGWAGWARPPPPPRPTAPMATSAVGYPAPLPLPQQQQQPHLSAATPPAASADPGRQAAAGVAGLAPGAIAAAAPPGADPAELRKQEDALLEKAGGIQVRGRSAASCKKAMNHRSHPVAPPRAALSACAPAAALRLHPPRRLFLGLSCAPTGATGWRPS